MKDNFGEGIPPQEDTEKQVFNEVHHLDVDDEYEGSADVVMLVWNDNQIIPAEQYCKAHYQDKAVDIAVCKDPNIQKEQIGDDAIIYDFGSSQSSSGGHHEKENS